MDFSVTNNSHSSAIADHLRALVGKRKLEITKMMDHFLQKKKKKKKNGF